MPRLRFLGTGTSTGVPQIGCHCEVCCSTDLCDKRLRTSAMLSLDNGAHILIDCGPDFRQQMLLPHRTVLVLTNHAKICWEHQDIFFRQNNRVSAVSNYAHNVRWHKYL